MLSSDISFKSYIYKILKKTYPANGITVTSLICLDNVVKIIIEKLMFGVNQITLHTKKKTIGHQDVQHSVQLILPLSIAKKAQEYASNCMEAFQKSKTEKSDEKKSKNSLANLTFPISRVQQLMMNISYVQRKSELASIYMAAICEFMILEIIKNAYLITEEYKKLRITTRHITLAIHQTEDMKKFYKNTIFAGGVAPS
jgi:histone H2A